MDRGMPQNGFKLSSRTRWGILPGKNDPDDLCMTQISANGLPIVNDTIANPFGHQYSTETRHSDDECSFVNPRMAQPICSRRYS